MPKWNRELLREKLQREMEDLTQYRKRLTELAREPSADPVDDAQSQVPADVAVFAINTDWETTKAVEVAFDRLENGDYGFCDSCGEPINPSRLDAISWATMCVRCQLCFEAAEDEVHVYHRADVSRRSRVPNH